MSPSLDSIALKKQEEKKIEIYKVAIGLFLKMNQTNQQLGINTCLLSRSLLRIGVSKERNLCDVHAICNLVFLFF
jgi:hypothetical protein